MIGVRLKPENMSHSFSLRFFAYDCTVLREIGLGLLLSRALHPVIILLILPLTIQQFGHLTSC